MTPHFTIARRSAAGRQHGLSLIELMISMALGLLLLAAITSLIVAQSGHRDELEKSSRQIENGRYASQVLREDIEHAGFYGQIQSLTLSSAPYMQPAAGVATPNPCMTTPVAGTGSLQAAMTIPIQGYDAPAASPIPGCLPDADFVPGTDILVIRRADSQLATYPTDTANGNIFLQAGPSAAVLAVGMGSTWGTTTSTFPLFYDVLTQTKPIPLRQYLVHIYFIAPCSNPTGPTTTTYNIPTCLSTDDDGHPVPTLMRLELGAVNGGPNTGWNLVPLVEGIEDMQFDYGMDTAGDTVPSQYTGYPAGYITAPADSQKWADVMAVRINLLARNIQCTNDYKDTKVYNLGLASAVSPPATAGNGCVNGDFKRHVFTELVRAVNPSGRRALQ
jgi:type IV pilus assembly protein PilW